MDAGDGAAASATASAAAANGSRGLVRAVVGCTSSPLFFWLLTVALVAAIHVASTIISSRNEEKERTKRKARRGAFAAAGEEREFAAAERNDDRILEMMRSFSFVQATEEDFLQGVEAFDRVAADEAPEPDAPSPASSFSFKFEHQMHEIPQEAVVVSGELPPREEEEYEREEEKVPSVPLESSFHQEHEDEAEKTELVVEEEQVEEQRREVVEAAPSVVVAATHNYQFLSERDFRGFVREPEAMTVRVQESFLPLPTPATAHPAQPEERRVVEATPRGGGGFLTKRDFRPADEPDARESIASSGKKTPSRRRKPASSPAHVCESVASSGKRTTPPPPPRSRKPARSPSVASRGSAAGGRMSFASEFSGFGDSDSESSGSDGYSVKELVVDSDSDWFLSEKDFPGARRDASARRSYEAKVLKAIEALEAAKLEQSYEDSVTTASPNSIQQGSPDSIPDCSAKYPEDMWSRSPSPDVEYKEDEKVVTEAKEAEERNMEEDEESIHTSDDDQSPGGKELALAPVYDAVSVADKSLDHSDKETITVNDYSGEAVSDFQRSPEAVSQGGLAVSDVQRSPEAISQRGLAVSDVQGSPEAVFQTGYAVSSNQVDGPDARISPEPSEHELVIDHSLEHISEDKRETASESDQSYEIVFDDKRRPEPLDAGFDGKNDHSHELISDVWKEIVSRNDQPCTEDSNDKGELEPADKKIVSANDHSNELISGAKKVTFSTANDHSYALVSDDKDIPETPEREFSANDHSYGMVLDAKHNLEYRKEEEQASKNDHSDDFARQAYVSVTGKAKMLDEDGEDPEIKWKDLTEEEEDELESLWEHQDLIEQLKLELKKVRSIGLPTILEESETPKAPMEDLKPWRMDAKFLREDPMDELNKFYKSYRERMRKFDILCYQKMYAIEFLQLRKPQQSNSLKSLSPTVASILSHNFRSSRRRSPEDPSERFLKELRYDLETVYVGQMCLSWEFLRWQYEEARDLPESDPYHSHQYNQVAGEFQQFQVVVQRFIEDESFKGPRLPNYINNRCVLRNLLQVPVIKEDSLKDRMEDQRKGNYVITSEELEEIMEEAMRVMWEFIKADKVETTSVLKGLSSTHVELQDPSDHDLMVHIHAALQKKEKRLKDLLKTGNCLVKKFKKPKEDRSNQNLFFSQVDMRLVARVLRMPRITSDQLQWCKAKLDKIIVVDRVKIHREPSFLLFPC
ncbi:hypothetical protein EJB05_42999 [Eragrostis curvula]|uniref:Uncharacterized protein n=1 Tax=Eragrostis curvula TaxID=38414 RepID=A0A5J9TDU5_9POAL|nr:hypothetical protein EJB05_42999 [Eragrostis curvula]